MAAHPGLINHPGAVFAWDRGVTCAPWAFNDRIYSLHGNSTHVWKWRGSRGLNPVGLSGGVGQVVVPHLQANSVLREMPAKPLCIRARIAEHRVPCSVTGTPSPHLIENRRPWELVVVSLDPHSVFEDPDMEVGRQSNAVVVTGHDEAVVKLCDVRRGPAVAGYERVRSPWLYEGDDPLHIRCTWPPIGVARKPHVPAHGGVDRLTGPADHGGNAGPGHLTVPPQLPEEATLG
jgi:hypothetical protein